MTRIALLLVLSCVACCQSTPPRVVDGLTVRGTVHRWEDGTLRGCRLAADATLAGHRFPAGTQAWFRPDGTLENVWLPRSQEILGIPCRGGGKIQTSFHRDGSLSSVFLSRDFRWRGELHEPSLMKPLRFEPGEIPAPSQASDLVKKAPVR